MYLPVEVEVEVEVAGLAIGDLHAVMSRGESSFVAIEIAGRATVSVDLVKGKQLRAPRIDTGDELVCVGLGDPVQDSIINAYEDLFAVLTDEHGYSRQDAYTVMSALAHTERWPDGVGDSGPVAPISGHWAGDPGADRQAPPRAGLSRQPSAPGGARV